MRHGQRPATTLKAWTAKYMEWIHGQVHFELAALEATLVDYVHEVDHAAGRLDRLEQADAGWGLQVSSTIRVTFAESGAR